MSDQKYRLVTRSDFDGLVCAVLLNELDLIDDIKFVHPKDMQDGKIEITEPRHHHQPALCRHGATWSFDHHCVRDHAQSGRAARTTSSTPTRRRPRAWSTTTTVAAKRFPDRFDGHDGWPWTRPTRPSSRSEEILEPTGWVLLNYLMDSRTGLGRFREFRICNYQLMMDLINYCRNHGIDDILALPDVNERVELYFEHAARGRGADQALHHRARQPRRARPAQRGDDLRHQPFHDLRAVPARPTSPST